MVCLLLLACVCVSNARNFFFGGFLDFDRFFANFWPNNISKKVSLLRPLLCLFMFRVINVLECNQTYRCPMVIRNLASFSFYILYFKLYCIFKLFNAIIKRYGFVQIHLRKRGRHACGYSLIYPSSKDCELVSVRDSESLNKAEKNKTESLQIDE